MAKVSDKWVLNSRMNERKALHSFTMESGLTIDSSVLEARKMQVAATSAGSNSTKLYLWIRKHYIN